MKKGIITILLSVWVILADNSSAQTYRFEQLRSEGICIPLAIDEKGTVVGQNGSPLSPESWRLMVWPGTNRSAPLNVFPPEGWRLSSRTVSMTNGVVVGTVQSCDCNETSAQQVFTWSADCGGQLLPVADQNARKVSQYPVGISNKGLVALNFEVFGASLIKLPMTLDTRENAPEFSYLQEVVTATHTSANVRAISTNGNRIIGERWSKSRAFQELYVRRATGEIQAIPLLPGGNSATFVSASKDCLWVLGRGDTVFQNQPTPKYFVWHGGTHVFPIETQGRKITLRFINSLGQAAGYEQLPDGTTVPILWYKKRFYQLRGAGGLESFEITCMGNNGELGVVVWNPNGLGARGGLLIPTP